MAIQQPFTQLVLSKGPSIGISRLNPPLTSRMGGTESSLSTSECLAVFETPQHLNDIRCLL